MFALVLVVRYGVQHGAGQTERRVPSAWRISWLHPRQKIRFCPVGCASGVFASCFTLVSSVFNQTPWLFPSSRCPGSASCEGEFLMSMLCFQLDRPINSIAASNDTAQLCDGVGEIDQIV